MDDYSNDREFHQPSWFGVSGRSDLMQSGVKQGPRGRKEMSSRDSGGRTLHR